MPTPYRSPWATDEHELFRATVRDFAARELLPHEERFIAQGHIDPEVWTRAGEAGLLGCDIPAEHGGLGGDFGHECVVYEEIWRTGFSGFGKAVHEIAARYVLDYATDEQRARWLPRMVAGELVGAIAMSEPGAGSDLRGIATSAVRDGDDFVVNGSKTFITNGLLANLLMTVVRTDPDAGSKGVHAADDRDRRPRGVPARQPPEEDRPEGAGHVRAVLRGLPRARERQPRRRTGPVPADGVAGLRADDRRDQVDRGDRVRRRA